jgi:hypothetical protein
MRFTIELTRASRGFVTGRLIDTESGEGVFYESTVVTDETKTSQMRVLKDIARHLNWYIDLSEGGSK